MLAGHHQQSAVGQPPQPGRLARGPRARPGRRRPAPPRPLRPRRSPRTTGVPACQRGHSPNRRPSRNGLASTTGSSAHAILRGQPRSRVGRPGSPGGRRRWPPRPPGRRPGPAPSTSTRASWAVTPRIARVRTLRVLAAEQSGGDARADVGEGVGHVWSSPCRMIGAKRSSVRANSIRMKRCRWSESQRSEARMPHSMRRAGSGSPAMASRWARRMERKASTRISRQELVLGVEVPVEDAFAHAEAVHDAGHRGGVVALGGEAAGGDVHQLVSAPGALGCEPAGHGPQR